MAILLKPNEHRLRKPQQWAVRPDATDAPGLWDRAFLVVPFWDSYDNLAADVPAIPSLGAGSEAWSYNDRGLAWGDGTTSGGGRISYGALAGSVGQGQQTITFVGVLNTSDAAQRHLWRFNVSTAPLHVGRWNNASTFQVATTTGLNASWTLSAFTDQFHVFTWVLDGSGQTVDCYVDGVLQSPTGSASASFTGPASDDHQIFGYFNNFVAVQASMFVAHGRLLTEPEIQRLAADPFAMVRERRQVWARPAAGGATPATLNSGSYTQTGNNLTATRSLVANLGAGSYTLAGQNLTSARALQAALGAGSYTETGYDIAAARALQAALDAGSYTETGNNLSATRALQATLGAGAYTLTGYDITATAGLVAALDAGAYTVTGYTLTATRSLVANLDAGSYTVTGYDIDATVGGSTANLGAGAYTETGHDITATRSLVADLAVGSYTWTGNNLTAAKTTPAALNAGAYTATGFDITGTRALVAGLALGSYTLTGNNFTYVYSPVITSEKRTATATTSANAATYTDGANTPTFSDGKNTPV